MAAQCRLESVGCMYSVNRLFASDLGGSKVARVHPPQVYSPRDLAAAAGVDDQALPSIGAAIRLNFAPFEQDRGMGCLLRD